MHTDDEDAADEPNGVDHLMYNNNLSTQPNFHELLDSEDEKADDDSFTSLDSDDWSIVDEADPEIEDIPSDAQVCYDLYCATRSNKDFQLQLDYVKERKDLQGTEVPVTNGRTKKKLETTWVVDDDEDFDFVTDFVSDNQIGLKDVNFQNFDAGIVNGRPTRVNFLHILLPLWPGM